MPQQSNFPSPESYYHTLFHEMVHATGHPSRLNRTFGKKFGDPQYAREELIAELGACFLSAEAGLDKNIQIENPSGYIQHWKKNLKDDPKLIVQAASDAQKATNFILGRSIENQNELTSAQDEKEVKPLRWIDPPPQSVAQGLRRSA
jgi:antirestriction protein ArdC